VSGILIGESWVHLAPEDFPTKEKIRPEYSYTHRCNSFKLSERKAQ